ncbi:MAG TPA: tetratricopeptide repeat protein [Anaeromyxobacteraceae bacterium]|nr:tetratricopeptide repeat protein [Anaeromyxobacteraceae bacterium]
MSPRIPLLALGLGALAGCFVPLERGRQMELRLDRLEADSSDAYKRLDEQRAVFRDRIAKVDAKLAEVQKKLDELNQSARRSGADLSVGLDKLKEDLSRLRGDLEVEQHKLAQVEQSVDKLRGDTDGRLAALKGAGALDEYEARKKIAALERPDDRAAIVALGAREEAAGQRGVALEIYEQVVTRWPADPAAAEAGYRAGRILLAQKRWRDAILALGRVAEAHPKAEQAPDAMVGVSEAMIELGMTEDAKAVLQQVVEKYPKAPAARNARESLRSLAAEGKKPGKR